MSALSETMAPGNAGALRPFGVKLWCSMRLNLPFSAIAASYTWISSVCAKAIAGAATRAMARIANARRLIVGTMSILPQMHGFAGGMLGRWIEDGLTATF